MPIVLPLEPAIRGRGCRFRLVPRSTRVLVGAGIALAVAALVGMLAGMLYQLGWTRPDSYDYYDDWCCICGVSIPDGPLPDEEILPSVPITDCLVSATCQLEQGVIGPKRPHELTRPITDEDIAARMAADPIR